MHKLTFRIKIIQALKSTAVKAKKICIRVTNKLEIPMFPLSGLPQDDSTAAALHFSTVMKRKQIYSSPGRPAGKRIRTTQTAHSLSTDLPDSREVDRVTVLQETQEDTVTHPHPQLG